MSNKHFEGYYFKHQKDGRTVAFIPGQAGDSAFVQVITDKNSYNFEFDHMRKGDKITVGGCEFRRDGISVALPGISGEIRYYNRVPIAYDIMGPFKYLPMQCRHGVLSMRHSLDGSLNLEGEILDFTGGVGYIEKDSGSSFPRKYMWLQCNNFPCDCGIMASVADIPFGGLKFRGCICAVIYKGREYRLATYLGVKILHCERNKLELLQGKYRLDVDIDSSLAHPLNAPVKGKMNAVIHESSGALARFQFFENGLRVFDLYSENASFEWVDKLSALN